MQHTVVYVGVEIRCRLDHIFIDRVNITDNLHESQESHEYPWDDRVLVLRGKDGEQGQGKSHLEGETHHDGYPQGLSDKTEGDTMVERDECHESIEHPEGPYESLMESFHQFCHGLKKMGGLVRGEGSQPHAHREAPPLMRFYFTRFC